MPEAPSRDVDEAGAAELRRGWRILGVCLLGMCLSVNALPFYTFGVFAMPVTTGLGWARADYQFAVTIFAGCLLATGPFVGALADRFGPRRVALVSFACMATGFVLASRATPEPWTFYLAWLVIAGAGAGASKIVWTRMINSWFDRRRGLALGIALAGTGITAALGPPLVGGLIAEQGWRTAYVALAALVLGLGMPVVVLWFREPRPGELPAASIPQTATSASGAPDGPRDHTLREALATRTFWILIVAFALISLAVGGLVTNLVPILVDAGHEAAAAGRIAGLIGVTVIVARVGCGWLLDRVWGPGVASIAFLAPAAASLLLLTGAPSPAAAVAAALLVGVAGGAEFDIAAYLASRYFGRRHYGRIYGCVFAAIQAGVGTAGLVFGLGAGRDYSVPLATALAVSVGAAVLIPFAGPYRVLPKALGPTQPPAVPDRGIQPG